MRRFKIDSRARGEKQKRNKVNIVIRPERDGVEEGCIGIPGPGGRTTQ
jgi:hypothetical protein